MLTYLKLVFGIQLLLTRRTLPAVLMACIAVSAMPVLAPDSSGETHVKMIQAYKDAYMQLRAAAGANNRAWDEY